MNEDIQSKMEVTQVSEKQKNDLGVSSNDMSINRPKEVKKVNYKKLFLVSSFLLLVWIVIIVVYLMYYKTDLTTKNSNENLNQVFSVTVVPTIAFELYSDDYLEFEHPVDAEVVVETQRIYHPSGPERSINGIHYASISSQDRFKLEMYNYLYGGDFAYQTYEPNTKTLTDFITELNPAPEVTQVKTKLTVGPTITKLDQIDGYLVRFEEQNIMLLMSINESGIYESMNYGITTNLDFLGVFNGDSETIKNFIGLTCEIENDDDYVYCEQLITRFLDSVEKKFVEDESYVEPKLEAVLELRNSDTAALIDRYRFYFDNFEEGTYLNSSWNSVTVHNGQTRLGLSFFEPTMDYADISFSDLRDTAPVPDIQVTEVFSNLLRGELRASLGEQVSTYFSYNMYYPDPDKTECYKIERPGVDLKNYVGCTSYKLKLEGIDATIEATCNYNPGFSESWKVCDEMIKNLKVEKL